MAKTVVRPLAGIQAMPTDYVAKHRKKCAEQRKAEAKQLNAKPAVTGSKLKTSWKSWAWGGLKKNVSKTASFCGKVAKKVMKPAIEIGKCFVEGLEGVGNELKKGAVAYATGAAVGCTSPLGPGLGGKIGLATYFVGRIAQGEKANPVALGAFVPSIAAIAEGNAAQHVKELFVGKPATIGILGHAKNLGTSLGLIAPQPKMLGWLLA